MRNKAEVQTLTGGLEDLSINQQTITGGLEDTTDLPPEQLSEEAIWHVGDIIDGKYVVLDTLGQGAMGVVYKVYHQEWNLELAVKMPLTHLVANPGFKARFIQEAQTWIDLGLHPNVVQCWYVRDFGGIPRVFMDYLGGGSLKDWISQSKIRPGQWSLILDLMIQACDGLDHAHQYGVEVHRDVKPGNMLLTKDGELRVTDFGIAKRTGIEEGEERSFTVTTEGATHAITLTGSDMGTPEYSAPEQWGSARHADARADIYALGGVLFELCTGRRPFDDKTHTSNVQVIIARHIYAPAPDPRTFNQTIPQELVTLMLQCLSKKPEERPQSMQELREHLRQAYAIIVGKPYRRLAPKAAQLRSDALNNRAISFLDLKQEQDALAVWQQALKFDPFHPESLYNTIVLQWHHGQMTDDEAVQRVRPASTSARMSAFLGLLHLERHAAVEAEAAFSEALKDVEINAQGNFWRALGDARMAQEKFAEARAAYQKALELFPEDTECQKRHVLAQKQTRYIEHTLLFPWQRCAWEFTGHRKGVTALVISPDGHLAISGSQDKTIKVWDIEHRITRATFPAPHEYVTALTITVDGVFVVSGHKNGKIRIWNVEACELVTTCEGHQQQITALALEANNNLCISASHDHTLRIWNIITGQCVRVLKGHKAEVTTVAVTPNGKYAVSGSEDGTRRIWDIQSGKCVQHFRGKWYARFLESFEATTLAVTPDSNYAFSGSWDSRVFFWKLATGEKLWAKSGHQKPVTAVAISPDGKLAVSGSQDTTLRLWELDHEAPTLRFEGHRGIVNAVAFMPDGAHFVSAGDDASIKIWDVNTGACVWTVVGSQGHVRPISALAIMPRGRGAISGGQDAVLKLWDLQAKTCLHTLRGHRKAITTLAILPDGHAVVSGSADKTLRLWDLHTFHCIRTYRGHTQEVTALALTPDGQYAVSGAKDASVQIWNLTEGTCVQKFEPSQAAITCLALLPDNQMLLSADAEKMLCLWNIKQGRCLKKTVNSQMVTAMAKVPGQRHVMLGMTDATIHIWDPDAMQSLCSWRGHTKAVTSLVITPNGKIVISSSEDETIRIWEMATGRCLRTFEGHQGCVYAIAMSADASILLSGGQDAILRLWQLELEASHPEASLQVCRQRSHRELESARKRFKEATQRAKNSLQAQKFTTAYRYLSQARAIPGYERDRDALELNAVLAQSLPKKYLRGVWLSIRLKGHTAAVTGIAIMPSSGMLITGSQDATARVWQKSLKGSAWKCIQVCKAHTLGITAVAVTPDGRFFVSGSHDTTLRLWDMKTGKCLRTYTGHTQTVNAVAVSRCGRFILSASDDQTLRIWNPATADCLKQYKERRSRYFAATIMPDSQSVISGGQYGTLRQWSLSSGEQTMTFSGHTQAVMSALVTSDGRWLVSASQDTTIRVWNLATATCRLTLNGHTGPVTALAVTQDGRYLVSGSVDTTLKIWELATGTLLWTLEDHEQHDKSCASNVKTVALTHNARFIVSGGDDATLRIWELDWELQADR